MGDTVLIPRCLLRAILVELDKCNELLDEDDERMPPSDEWFRTLILSPTDEGLGDVDLYSDDVKRLIDRCLSVIRDLMQRNANVAAILAAEKERIDGVLEGDSKGKSDPKSDSDSHSGVELVDEDDKDLYNWEADHGY